ncbi:MAG: KpsF/GutQ family sugar-phosphate isomerase [Rhabdochlamydiaceae bacterium]|nr:KpsF/GutQ family sugar-phosphate isomerase [Candidatus Amphrikana amoebophyrae]
MLKALFKQQKKEIESFFNKIDLEHAQIIFEEIANCKGNIVLTGIGKSGIIAEKIAKTMSSTGTKALALSAIDAMHGDIGILGRDDLFIVLSKSGHTKELKELIRIVKLRNIRVMGWFCNDKAQLKPDCDLVMQLPIESELCPFDLAPTTSTEVQLIFGDILAIALMKSKQFSLSQYAMNHPAGTIGKKSTLRVEELMLSGSELPTCLPESNLGEILVELTNKRCGCILVVDKKNNLLGIFTDGDLRRSIQKYAQEAFGMKMKNLMTKTYMSVSAGSLAIDAVNIMQHDPQKRVMMLPVVQGDKLEGLVTMHDVVNLGIL